MSSPLISSKSISTRSRARPSARQPCGPNNCLLMNAREQRLWCRRAIRRRMMRSCQSPGRHLLSWHVFPYMERRSSRWTKNRQAARSVSSRPRAFICNWIYRRKSLAGTRNGAVARTNTRNFSLPALARQLFKRFPGTTAWPRWAHSANGLRVNDAAKP